MIEDGQSDNNDNQCTHTTNADEEYVIVEKTGVTTRVHALCMGGKSWICHTDSLNIYCTGSLVKGKVSSAMCAKELPLNIISLL